MAVVSVERPEGAKMHRMGAVRLPASAGGAGTLKKRRYGRFESVFDLGHLGPDTNLTTALAAAGVFAAGRQSGRRIDRAERTRS